MVRCVDFVRLLSMGFFLRLLKNYSYIVCRNSADDIIWYRPPGIVFVDVINICNNYMPSLHLLNIISQPQLKLENFKVC